ncbi:phage portal protein [Sandaracinobacter sp. RS1-74]|uniref:phage portal protein n=1 Tax=Sandaracinobacteroides sayramensis TaxID=2913411 RepID=UPI001EDC8559|nr:phage portal protein [Sandaracinobacteroides sayramensis]MCG2839768.1 phage portal protein [Sandaracinobacteroides sayramensis]
MNWARRWLGGAGRKSLHAVRPWAVAAGGAEVPASYEGQVRAALRNPVALRAVRLVAEGLASVTLEANEPGHPSLALVTPALLEGIATNLLLAGNAHVQVGLDLGGRPGELWLLRPERMRLETDADGRPQSWAYQLGGRVQRLPAEGDALEPGVLHLKAVNPLDDHLGLGALEAASEPVALLQAAGRWNRSLIANAARPSGALVLDSEDGVLSPEQFERLAAEIEAGFQGASNAGRPMLLEGGLKWQALSLTPAEMDFQKAREAAARDVALAFGVPPMLLGLPGDSTHANYAEANVALWRLTILPMLGRILDGLSRHLGLWWPGLRLEPDLDLVPALWADRERLWRHVGDATFLSDDEKREILGWAPVGKGGRDGL